MCQLDQVDSDTIYPVILPVPEKNRDLPVREKVIRLKEYARDALRISAKKSGIKSCYLKKDEKGVPLPFDGNYWSISHKPEYVCGVVALTKTGIDLEKIRPCSKALFRKTANDREWSLLDDTDPYINFFRYWTSKEAVLKAVGTGIMDLLKCSVEQIIDDKTLIISYRDKRWLIEHFFFNGHIASVVKDAYRTDWTFM